MSDKKEYCCPSCHEKTITADERLWAISNNVTCPNCGKKLSERITLSITLLTVLIIVMVGNLLFPNVDFAWIFLAGMVPVIPCYLIIPKRVKLKEYKPLIKNKETN